VKEKHPLLISLAALAILLAGLFFSTEKMQAQTETVLYSFPGGRHGNTPAGGLVEDSKGRFYGTTVDGGLLSACGGFGCGVVYKVSPTGVESVLQRFTGGADGANPRGDLVRSASGNLASPEARMGLTPAATWFAVPAETSTAPSSLVDRAIFATRVAERCSR